MNAARSPRSPFNRSLLAAVQLSLLVTAGVLAQPVPALPESSVRSRLTAMLPVPGTVAQIMEPKSGISVVELQRRVSECGGDLKVLASVVGQIQSSGVPSYDERLCLSRAEFQRLLIFRPTLEQSGRTVRLSMIRDAGRVVFTDAQGSAPTLRGLVIDLNSGELSTAEGFSAHPNVIQRSPAQDTTGLGISGGFVWDVRGNNPRTQNALNGHLSLLQASGGQVLLSYSRVSIQKGRVSEDNLNLLFRR